MDPVTVLAGVLARDGGELSATETLERELSRADHLGVLGGIWDDLVRREQHARFEHALRDALPADLAQDALDDPACTWLWRSLREAELAGLDGGDVLRQAVAARSMTGARDIARVLDSRVRRMLDGVLPQPPGPWAARVPDTGSAEVNRYLRELAEAMDDRARRLGEHAAETQPLWARQAFGPLPDDPVGRADWEQRASVVAAYRERYGYAHPGDPIGPEPAKTSPEARAAWHAALHALGRVDGIDLRGCTDGDLWLRRSTYERETAWAPPHVAEELRLMRQAERDAHVNAVRAEHEAHAAPTSADRGPAPASRPDLACPGNQGRPRGADVRRRPGNPAAMGSRHPGHPPHRHRRRPRTAPPPPRPADTTAAPAPRRARRNQSDSATGRTGPGCSSPSTERRTCGAPFRATSATSARRINQALRRRRSAHARPHPSDRRDEIPEHVLRIRDNAKTAQAKLDELASLATTTAHRKTGLARPCSSETAATPATTARGSPRPRGS